MTSVVIVYQYRTESVREEYSIGIRFRQIYRKRGSMMERRNETVIKLAQTALMAALCYVAFTFLQIKIPMPGGDATSLHVGNAFCVLGALILGGWYGGLAGAVGMTIADLMDPVYITGAQETARPCKPYPEQHRGGTHSAARAFRGGGASRTATFGQDR